MIPFIDSILGRMPCPAHQGQVVQTFCKRRQCLKYLCSKCQMLHSQQHQAMGFLPDYESIQITITNCQDFLNQQIRRTDKSKLLLKKEQEMWEKKKRKTFSDLDKIQQQIIEETLRTFQQIKSGLGKKIVEFENAVGIRQGENFEDLYEIYEKEIEQLEKFKSLLKKSNCCAQLKSIFGEVLPKSEETIKKMTDNAVNNLHQNLSLNYNQEQFKNWLKIGLIGRVGINFHENLKINSPQYYPQPQARQSVISPMKTSFISAGQNIPNNQRDIRKVVYMGQSNLKDRIQNNINSSVIFTPNNNKKVPSIVEKHENLPMRRSSLFGRSKIQNLRY